MKAKNTVSTQAKKQAVALKDLKTRKNPKGGAATDKKGLNAVAVKFCY